MLSDKPWKSDAVLLLGAAIFFCLSATACLGLGVNYFLPELPEDDRQFFSFLANTLGFHGMTLVLTATFLRHHWMRWGEFLGTNQPRLARTLAWSVAVGILCVPPGLGINHLMAQLITWLQMTPEHQPTIKVLQISVSLWQRVAFGVTAIVLAPISEEILFRGILYPFVKQHFRPELAVVGTSLVFAVIHSNLMTFIPLFLFSLVLIWLYENTDTLLAPIVTHALFNAVNFTLFFFEPQLRAG